MGLDEFETGTEQDRGQDSKTADDLYGTQTDIYGRLMVEKDGEVQPQISLREYER